ncbi:hypothetical protein C487_00080 [Natrinema pallidum DSM 3751]|uniref:Transmembrane protein n=1 Tax=Natrinema pallidum DSM 3751 TaxID=1227495 RepID=L9ZG65_9EURY|nr:hypothetical protein C487_00080 [Natrinema pallidum DSM 3751]
MIYSVLGNKYIFQFPRSPNTQRAAKQLVLLIGKVLFKVFKNFLIIGICLSSFDYLKFKLLLMRKKSVLFLISGLNFLDNLFFALFIECVKIQLNDLSLICINFLEWLNFRSFLNNLDFLVRVLENI